MNFENNELSVSIGIVNGHNGYKDTIIIYMESKKCTDPS